MLALLLVPSLLAAVTRIAAAPLSSGLTLDVDRTDDSATATACTAGANDCSLRGAIITANANADSTINLQSGVTYTLSLGGADSALGSLIATSGDLDITAPLTLNGHGATIDAAGIDRVFQIENASLTSFAVTLRGVTVRGGTPNGTLSHGGGILVRAAG